MLTRLARNLRWGIAWGLAMAAVSCAWAAIVYVVTGGRALAGTGFTLGSIELTYVVAGSAVGVLVGLLRPVTRWRLGAIGLGVIGGIAGWAPFWVTYWGWVTRWDTFDWASLVVIGVVSGGALANSFWEDYVYPKLPPPKLPPGPPPPPPPLGLWHP